MDQANSSTKVWRLRKPVIEELAGGANYRLGLDRLPYQKLDQPRLKIRRNEGYRPGPPFPQLLLIPPVTSVI